MALKLFDRIATLLKADAHGIVESLEERTLLLKQYVREAELELNRKRARLDALREEVAQCHRVGRKKRAQRKIFGHLVLGPDGALCLETSART